MNGFFTNAVVIFEFCRIIEIDGSWSFHTIDDGDGETIVGSSNSLAFTSDSQAYIAYTDDGGQDIRLATIFLTEAASADGIAASSGDASSGSATDAQVGTSSTSDGSSGTVADGGTSSGDDTSGTAVTVEDAGASSETEADDGVADGSSEDDGVSDGDTGDQADGGGGSCQLSPNRSGNPSGVIILGFLFLPLWVLRKFPHQNNCKIS